MQRCVWVRVPSGAPFSGQAIWRLLRLFYMLSAFIWLLSFLRRFAGVQLVFGANLFACALSKLTHEEQVHFVCHVASYPLELGLALIWHERQLPVSPVKPIGQMHEIGHPLRPCDAQVGVRFRGYAIQDRLVRLDSIQNLD